MRSLSTSNVLAGTGCQLCLLWRMTCMKPPDRIQAIEEKIESPARVLSMQERMTRIAAERKWWLTIPQCPEGVVMLRKVLDHGFVRLRNIAGPTRPDDSAMFDAK